MYGWDIPKFIGSDDAGGRLMSYCRFGKDSNVYLYPTFGKTWVCCNCRLSTELIEGIGFHHSFALVSLEGVKAHLEAHLEAGHLVPDYAFERVAREMKVEAFRHKRRRTMRRSVCLDRKEKE